MALIAATLLTGPASAGATVADSEAESFGLDHGGEVVADGSASGGELLRLDSRVTAIGTVVLDGPADRLVIRTRTWDWLGGDGQGARIRITVDGDGRVEQSVPSVEWTELAVAGSWTAGPHEVKIRFLNPQELNVDLDTVRFESGGDEPAPAPLPSSTTAPPPTVIGPPTTETPPTTEPTTAPAPTEAPTSTAAPTTPPGADAGESGTVITDAYITGYSWWDNTPPGSSAISHPGVHQVAGGTGTWDDPITVAVGHDLSSGSDVLDHPAGTRFYIPDFQRYFLVEDTCGDGATPEDGPCHVPPAGSSTWLDVWIDGETGTRAATDACMADLTGNHTVIVDPDPNRPVDAGPIFSDGACQV